MHNYNMLQNDLKNDISQQRTTVSFSNKNNPCHLQYCQLKVSGKWYASYFLLLSNFINNGI